MCQTISHRDERRYEGESRMHIEPLEVYSAEVNYAVIKPPGRSYPAAVIQGDSLGILCRKALRAVGHIQRGDMTSEDFLGEVEDLANSLIDRMLHYQEVLRAHGIDDPHVHPFTERDLVQFVPTDEESS